MGNLIDRLLGDFGVEKFLQAHFNRLPFSRPDHASDLRDCLTWDVVRAVLERGKSVLRVVNDGKMVLDQEALSFSQAQEYYRTGHTLLLRYAERSHPILAEIAGEFRQFFGAPVDIQAYCTPPGGQAFLWHFDIEEVFIIQTQGSKHYTIRQNTVHPYPVMSSVVPDMGYERERSPLKLEVTLRQGDWLYIPSGWWHIARTLEESMHLSVGVMPITCLDLLDFLKIHLAPMELWRVRLPTLTLAASERQEYYAGLMGALSQALDRQMKRPDTLEGFIRHLHGDPSATEQVRLEMPENSEARDAEPSGTLGT